MSYLESLLSMLNNSLASRRLSVAKKKTMEYPLDLKKTKCTQPYWGAWEGDIQGTQLEFLYYYCCWGEHYFSCSSSSCYYQDSHKSTWKGVQQTIMNFFKMTAITWDEMVKEHHEAECGIWFFPTIFILKLWPIWAGKKWYWLSTSVNKACCVFTSIGEKRILKSSQGCAFVFSWPRILAE